VTELEGEVSDLNSTKANQITIAPFFSAEASYSVGDLVYYNGLTYRCTNDHEGEWDADDFAATTIAVELDALKSGLTALNNKFKVVTTGSLHDITESGIYYITGGVSDRPMDGGGMYIVSVYNSDLLVGVYVGFMKDNQNRQIQLVSLTGGNWIVADIASTPRT
jgi:hypothetical protein